MLTYNDVSKKSHVVFKMFFTVLVVTYYKSQVSSRSIAVLYQKKSMARHVGGNKMNHLIHCITSNFLNIAFYNLVYTIFIVYICMKQNLWFKKLSHVLHLFDLVWGSIWRYSIKSYVFLVLLVSGCRKSGII